MLVFWLDLKRDFLLLLIFGWEGFVLSDWKNFNIVPIPKSKTYSSSPSDYCPISLLSLPSKILEWHIFNYLYDFYFTHYIILIVSLVPTQTLSLNGSIICCQFLVFSIGYQNSSLCCLFLPTKAFHSVHHKPLLDSLSSLNLTPLSLSWLHSYLQVPTQQVVINDSHSSKSQVTSGVPQGSILRLFYS